MIEKRKQGKSIAVKKQRFFGRRISRKLSNNKIILLKNSLPNYEITTRNIKSFLINKKNRGNDVFWLEIGFGSGEHLINQALKNPNIFFIGCDLYINGIVSLLNQILEKNINNIAIFTEDARELVNRSPKDLFSKVFILFPDPWPKKRHFKRRLINQEFLNSLSRVMEHDGILHICSDVLSYVRWILYQIAKNSNFIWIVRRSNDWPKKLNNHVLTKYEQKAKDNSRVIFNLEFMSYK